MQTNVLVVVVRSVDQRDNRLVAELLKGLANMLHVGSMCDGAKSVNNLPVRGYADGLPL